MVTGQGAAGAQAGRRPLRPTPTSLSLTASHDGRLGVTGAVTGDGPLVLGLTTTNPDGTRSPSVSVVICCYTEQRWDDLVAAVESVKRQRTPPLETILVVDHNPALLERIRAQIADVVVVENRGCQGLAGARNTGVDESKGEVVVFLDDDAAAEPDWLEALVAPYDDPQVLGVGGWIQAAWKGARPPWFPQEFDWVVGCSYQGSPTVASRVRNLIGANMSLRREVFDAVGGFREGIGRVGTRPLGCEETELCIRANRCWPNRFFVTQPSARVLHTVGPERARWRYFWSRCYAEGLSKAQVASFEGMSSGLASERTHAMKALPRGVVRGVADTIVGGDPSGVIRGLVVVVGLCVTTAGFVTGTVNGHAACFSWARKV